ncbi:SLC13 family permease [Paenibacillus tarimensis]
MIPIEAVIVGSVLALMLLCLFKEWLTIEAAVFSALSVLILFNVLTPVEALGGFANESVFTVIFFFIIAAAIQSTGMLNRLMKLLLGKERNLKIVLCKLMLPVSALSGFMNNTPIVSMLIPVVRQWGKQAGIAPSKLLIPLSYAAILGGTMTLIGTSTNLFVHGLLLERGLPGFSMFDFFVIGFPLSLIACVYMVFAGRKLLPCTADTEETLERETDDYCIPFLVPKGSKYIGKTLQKAKLRQLNQCFLVEIIRGARTIVPPSHAEEIQENDILIFSGDILSMKQLADPVNLIFYTENPLKDRTTAQLVEVMIPEASPLMNKRIKEIRFRSTYNAAVVAIRRQNMKIASGIGNTLLKRGDVLVLLTGKDFCQTWSKTKNFYIISSLETSATISTKKSLAIVSLILGVVALSAFQVISIFHAALIGVIILFLTKTVTSTDAKSAIDLNVVIVMGSSVGIGYAVEKSGLSDLILSGLFHDRAMSFFTVTLIMYLLTNVLTELIHNLAAAALTFPIGSSMAISMGYDPALIALVIAVAASCSFISPIGYQTNLMVYGPGRYTFRDYLKVGLPLSLICMGTTLFIVNGIIV